MASILAVTESGAVGFIFWLDARVIISEDVSKREPLLCALFENSRYYRPRNSPRINQTRLFSFCFRLLFTIASSPALFTASFRINKP